eukprot:8261355-Pyramimonas_sp.AAC.1
MRIACRKFLDVFSAFAKNHNGKVTYVDAGGTRSIREIWLKIFNGTLLSQSLTARCCAYCLFSKAARLSVLCGHGSRLLKGSAPVEHTTALTSSEPYVPPLAHASCRHVLP